MQILQDNDDGIKFLNDVDYFKVLDFIVDSIYNINCCEGDIIEVQPVSPRSNKSRRRSRIQEEEEEKVPLNDVQMEHREEKVPLLKNSI